MTFAIVAGVSAGASLLATGYSIYNSEQQQKRADTIAQNAADQTSEAEAEEKAKQAATQNQQAELAAVNQAQQNQPYTRDGTILSSSNGTIGGGGGMGTQGSGKTLLGE